MPLDITIHRFSMTVGICVVALTSLSRAATDNPQVPIPMAANDKIESVAVEDSHSPAVEPVDGPTLIAQADTTNLDRTAQKKKDEIELLIIQALDQQMDLEVEDVPIQDAIQMLSDKTGIPIFIEADTFDLLPYGSKTTLSATIKNQPLRKSLTALLQPIGLTFEPLENHLLIKGRKQLTRICRRATWEELATLKTLYSNPWSKDLFDSLRFQFLDIPEASAEANREQLFRLAESVGEGSAADVLEHACNHYGWVWYPSEQYIVVGTKVNQVKRQLNKRISLRYRQAHLRDVLLDLTNQAGVLLQMEPGVLASLPADTARRFSVSIENATILQALEIIAGETGLGYFIEPDGIRFTTNFLAQADSNTDGAEATAQATVAALRANSIVGQLSFPNPAGPSFSFFIRKNDLPPEVDEIRKAKIEEAVQAMCTALQAEQHKD